MLLDLFEWLTGYYGGFRVFGYLTLRAIFASLTALTHVTITGRLYMDFWSDRHCPEEKNNDPTQFDGLWYLYVAVTYDGGATWVTSNASPGDPVQRGPICMDGTGCGGYRNLLDFNDIAIDERGRILVGYSDGCVGNCVDGGPNLLRRRHDQAPSDRTARSTSAVS